MQMQYEFDLWCQQVPEAPNQRLVEIAPLAPALHVATIGALTRQTLVDCGGNGQRKRGCHGLPVLHQAAEVCRLDVLRARQQHR